MEEAVSTRYQDLKKERLDSIKAYFSGLREQKTSGIVEGFDVKNLARNADKGVSFCENVGAVELGDYTVVKKYIENSYGSFQVGQMGRVVRIVDQEKGKIAVKFDVPGEADMFVGKIGKEFVIVKFDKNHILSEYSDYSFRELQFAVMERVLNYLLLSSDDIEDIEDLVDLRNEVVFRRRCN